MFQEAPRLKGPQTTQEQRHAQGPCLSHPSNLLLLEILPHPLNRTVGALQPPTRKATSTQEPPTRCGSRSLPRPRQAPHRARPPAPAERWRCCPAAEDFGVQRGGQGHREAGDAGVLGSGPRGERIPGRGAAAPGSWAPPRRPASRDCRCPGDCG